MKRVKPHFFWLFKAVIVLTFIALIPLSCNRNNKNKSSQEQLLQISGCSSIPTDAIAVACFSNYDSPLFFLNSNSLFGSIINLLGENSTAQVVISLHYSAKNEVELLYSVMAGEGEDLSGILKDVVNRYNLPSREFGNSKIFGNGTFSVALSGRYLLFSSSDILVESSLRHIESNTSILDNKEFLRCINDNLTKENVIIINNLHFGKLFSGLTKRDYWGFAPYFRNFSSWVTLNMEVSEKRVALSGTLINSRGEGNYSDILNGVEPSLVDAKKILPSSTTSFISISSKDISKYFGNFSKYEIFKSKVNDPLFNIYIQSFIKRGLTDIICAYIKTGDSNEKVILTRFRDNSASQPLLPKGSLSLLFGGWFADTSGTIHRREGEWEFMGSESAVNLIMNSMKSDSTLHDYLKERRIYSEFGSGHGVLNVYLNPHLLKSNFESIFNDRALKLIESATEGKKRVEVINLEIGHGANGPDFNLLFVLQK